MTWLHQFTAIELFVEIAILNLIGMTIKVNHALGSIPPGSSKMGDATDVANELEMVPSGLGIFVALT